MGKLCFVIAPIGEPDSETRRRSDQVLKHIIGPAVNECGYEAIRADQISEPGLITSQIIQHIVDAKLVVADLTGRNPNVFYEIALRHALKKPLIQLIEKGEQLPFDIAGMRTIPINHHDLDDVEDSKKDIVKQIRSLEIPGAQIETPISVALDLQILRQSGNPEQRSLADLVSTIAELRVIISNMTARLSDPSLLLPPSYLREIIRGSEALGIEDMALRDEMAYLISQLSNSLKDNNLNDDNQKQQILRYLESMRELLSRLSNRYKRI